MEITWITQGGFIFEHSGHRLVVDPYLSDVAENTLGLTRLAPAPVSIENLRPDTLFCSHNHIDHLDPVSIPLIAKQYPLCHFIGPRSVTDDLVGMGIDPERITALKAGVEVKIGKFRLIATPAYHSDQYAIGLVIHTRQKTIYLSGDTLYRSDLAQDVVDHCSQDIDLVLICINGKLGNMNIDEAVNVVKQLQPRVAVPMHYGLFAENTIDPEAFVSKCNEIGISTSLFTVGKSVNLNKLLLRIENEDN